MSQDIVIKTTNISKSYRLYDNPKDRLKEAFNPFRKTYHRDFYALKNINLEVSQGQSIGIIGMNGSGKSTLLQIITGVLNPSSGSIHTNGSISALLELGVGFNPEFSGIDNIYFQCSVMGYNKEDVDRMLDGIIAFADIGNFVYQPVKIYSSGMYVRLAFSVAININPEILIIDEALAVGDIGFQTKCMRRIKAFKEAGKTLLFVSHDPGAVKTLCDKAYLLNKGELVDEGTPDQVFDYYNSLIALKNENGKDPIRHKKEAVRKRSGNNKVTITTVILKNSKGQETDVVVSGENISFLIKIRVHEDIQDPTIGILIRDRLGNDIFGINNNIMNKFLGVLKGGSNYTFSYKIPLNLGQGIYNLTVAAHSDETHLQENYDWINAVLTFQVIQSTELKFIGYCRLNPIFELEAE